MDCLTISQKPKTEQDQHLDTGRNRLSLHYSQETEDRAHPQTSHLNGRNKILLNHDLMTLLARIFYIV